LQRFLFRIVVFLKVLHESVCSKPLPLPITSRRFIVPVEIEIKATTVDSVFSMLKVGQTVSLKGEGAAYILSFIEPEVPLGHTVVEIGENYVVVRDITGVMDVVVPVYSVKAVEKVRTKLE
jgi:hypothetical protein